MTVPDVLAQVVQLLNDLGLAGILAFGAVIAGAVVLFTSLAKSRR